MNSLNHQSYAWILTHPDDEVYTINIIKRLVESGKKVDLIYATSGDYAGDHLVELREAEVLAVGELVGIDAKNIHFVRIAERGLFDAAPELLDRLKQLVHQIDPDCVVGHAFEGGHNGHDLVSFCSDQAAQDSDKDFWVFPAYHKQPHERAFNTFATQSDDDYQLMLEGADTNLKRSAVAAHATQADFYKRLLSSPNAEQYLSREVLRHVTHPIDYTQAPTNPVGYEFAGSSLRFADFVETVNQLLS